MATSFKEGERLGDIESAPTAIQDDPRPSEPLTQHPTFNRTGSINFTTGPARVNTRAKIVGEFRTLRYVPQIPISVISRKPIPISVVFMSPTPKKVEPNTPVRSKMRKVRIACLFWVLGWTKIVLYRYFRAWVAYQVRVWCVHSPRSIGERRSRFPNGRSPPCKEWSKRYQPSS